MSSDATHVIAYTAFSDHRDALAMARSVVERQLAASVQVHETTTVRPIDGRLQELTQFVLAMRTATPMIQALKAHVLVHNREEVPEFVVVPIVAANQEYLGWIDDYVDERRTLTAASDSLQA
ncbi:MAG: divalent-cation tolerance protein CutA [Chloroflexi bacterium]|nr:divalent-cation tolerance protein CutA [Chloroflexota bacterium]